MDSAQRLSLIYFVSTFMLILSGSCDPQFIEYFTRSIGKYHSSFTLSTLKDADRQIICNTLGREPNNYTTNDEILLVRVQIKNHPPIYPVPAFQCASIRTSFYATYVVPDLFFKMAFVSSSFSEGDSIIMTKITSRWQISAYNDSENGISVKILVYLNSDGYRVQANNVLRQYLLNNTWKELCAKYHPQLQPVNDYSDASSVSTRPLYSRGHKLTNGTPVIRCEGVHGKFFVAYFTDGILFSIKEDYRRQIDGMKPQYSDNINDVLLTSTPWLHELLPLELEKDIKSRCKRE